jgi:2'-5' RNA ligase
MRPRIEEALRPVTSAEPARLNFRGLGFFPNPRRPRVFWAGVEASGNLAPLAAEIEAALESLGIRREKRDYRPHLTLGRFKGSKGLSRLQEKIRSLPTTEFGEQEAQAFFLYRSRLSPQGAQYTKLAEFPTTEFGEQEAQAFFLYQSRLSPQGAQYTKLAEFPLGRVEG